MFKHILFPTDGSALSLRAMGRCIEFAKDAGARLTALHVMPEFPAMIYATPTLEGTQQRFELESERLAKEYLSVVEAAAKEANVPCETLYINGGQPYAAIVHTAQQRQCDLIAMASHGRKGIEGMLLGSETHKVLTHTDIAVLVLR